MSALQQVKGCAQKFCNSLESEKLQERCGIESHLSEAENPLFGHNMSLEISALSSSPGLSTGRCPIAPTFSSPSSPSLCLNFHCTCCQTVWIYPRPGSPSTTCFCSPPGKPVSRGQGSMLLLSLLRAGFLVFCSHACHFCQKPWCESKPFNL